MHRQIIRKSFIAAAVLLMILSSLPHIEYAYASDSGRIGKVSNLKVKDNYDTVTLSWSKASGRISGYSVYRNGKKFCTTGRNERGVTIMIERDKLYKYKVRAFRRYYVKQWYSRRTHKWQNKRIKGAKTRRVRKYKYGEFSKVRILDTREDKEIKRYTVTDYRGVRTRIRRIRKPNGSTYLMCKEAGSNESERIEKDSLEVLARLDRTVDGTFTITDDSDNSEIPCFQKNGATVLLTKEPDRWPLNGHACFALLYNGDLSKLDLKLQSEVITADTKSYDQQIIQKSYIMGDRYRLAEIDPQIVCTIDEKSYQELFTEQSKSNKEKDCTVAAKCVPFYSNVGFETGDVLIDVSYDGDHVGTMTHHVNFGNNGKDESYWGVSDKNYDEEKYPTRAFAIEIGRRAVEEASTSSYDDDMTAISDYIDRNYCYDDAPGNIWMNCEGGAYVLETWSIYRYGVYGYMSYGSQPPGSPNYGTHAAFYPDPNPYSGKEYYEAQGHD